MGSVERRIGVPWETDTCPHSGLPVRGRPEWTDVDFGTGYRLTIRLIGDGVLDRRPSGRGTLRDGIEALRLTAAIADEEIGIARPYVQIEDYENLAGATLEARRYFIDAMKRRENLLGLVFCGASAPMRISIALGRRLHFLTASVRDVPGYPEAITTAVEMLHAGRIADRSHPIEPGNAITGRTAMTPSGEQLHGRHVVARPEWQLELDGLTTGYEVIDEHILHSHPRGRFDGSHVEAILGRRREVAVATGLDSREHFILTDLDHVTVNDLATRRRYLELETRWHAQHPLVAMVFYGTNRLLRAAVRIYRPFVPFRVELAGSLEEGLVLIDRMVLKRDLVAPQVPAEDLRDRQVSGAAIEELLRLLGGLDWEKEGLPAELQAYGPGHPLASVFDAFMVVKADVDELFAGRRRALEQLRQREERYKALLDGVVEGYFEVDLAGTMTFCNEPMLQVLGYPREELIGLNNRTYMDEANAKKVFETFNQVFRSGNAAEAFGWELIRKDGTRIVVETSVALRRSEEGSPIGFRGVLRDVTERIRNEEARETLEAQLRRAQRAEAIGTLAGGVAHNFNNLLMGIQGNVGLLLMDLVEDDPLREPIERIGELVSSGAGLTAQLLGFARAGRHTVQAIEVNPLVRSVADTIRVTRRDVRVRVELDPDVAPVRADRGQIEEVLLNLAINACDAMPSGGDLTFQSSSRVEESGAGEVAITVRDTGAGMDHATQERIFEPFFTTKGLGRGTGLGLASAWGIVQSHKGRFEVESAPGMGSSFTIVLPATAEVPETRAVSSRPLVRGTGTVLIVDDEPAVLDAGAKILARLGYEVLPARSGNQAIEIFEQRKDEIALVVLDMILPDLGGGEVFDRLRAIRGDVRVLLASGYSREGEAGRILERGCDDFIEKPYTINQLAEKVAALIGPPGAVEPGQA